MSRNEIGRLGALKTKEIRCQKRLKIYCNNPPHCKHCDGIITLEKARKKRKFCSQSCSATFNNIHRTYIPRKGSPNIQNWNEIKKYYETPHSAKECCEKFNLSMHTWRYGLKRNFIQPYIETLENVLPLFETNIPTKLARRLILKFKFIPYHCDGCKNLGTWQDKPLSLDLDHKDGDSTNNNLTNLRFLCPNCHHQTSTFGSRNRGKGRKYDREYRRKRRASLHGKLLAAKTT